MLIDLDKIAIYRIIHIENLERILRYGVYCKNKCKQDSTYRDIGSLEIISQRDTAKVKCYPKTVVNDYVPFYFSVRTPMLYNIVTGYSVPKYPQEDIVYLCFKLKDLATNSFQWCYTNGNAAKRISLFFTELEEIANNIDWRSVYSEDFRDNNADGDEDRVRKKHAEFLVKDYVPTEYIKAIVVLNEKKKNQVEKLSDQLGLSIRVLINPKKKYYFI